MKMAHQILIIGSGSDLAAELAIQYGNAGWGVDLIGRNPKRMQSLVDALSATSAPRVTAHEMDLLTDDRLPEVIFTLDPFPDLVIYTAGLMADEHSDEAANQMMYINALIPSNLFIRIADEYARRGIQGTLVGVSSIAGIRGRQSNFRYGASKAAFIAFLSGLRSQYADRNIRVVTVLPGFMKTKMIAHSITPAVLTVPPARMASTIRRAVAVGKDVVYPNILWRLIAWVVMCIPERIFKRLRV